MFWNLLKLAALFALVGCGRVGASEPVSQAPSAVVVEELRNVFSLSPRVYSGSAPGGEETFAALATLGVKTIISVDGARPAVEAARRHGIRYVHLPLGYEGIPEETQRRLAKAAVTLDTPIYAHCHHGAHRGPAAAAILCMTRDGWTPAQSEAWLLTAGTSTNYAGLFRSVREFHIPSAAQLAAASAVVPEAAEVSSIVQAMTQIDRQFERLKRIQKADFGAPVESPDLAPANEVLILREHYRELQRLPAIQSKPGLLREFAAAEKEAADTERLLRGHSTANHVSALERSFEVLAQRCASCHKAHRDTR